MNNENNRYNRYDDIDTDLTNEEDFEEEEDENPFEEDFEEGFEEEEDENPFEEDFDNNQQENNVRKKTKKEKVDDEEKNDTQPKKKKNSNQTQNKMPKAPTKNSNISKAKNLAKASTTEKAKTKIIGKIGKKILAFLVKNPYILIALIIIVMFILFAIYLLLLGSSGSSNSNVTDSKGIAASKCSYNVNGINEETTVQLINCEATRDNYTVLETISLEKYIAGVAIAEMGENYVDEAMKAQLIAVRSYTLTRNINEYGVGYDSANNVIRMRACENDQVYWDYEKDIYRSENAVGVGVSKYSPEYVPSEGETPWKVALSEEAKRKYEAIISDVIGKYVTNSEGAVVTTDYNHTTTQKFKDLATNNSGSANGKYEAVLMNVYPDIKTIETATCTMMYYSDPGDYSNWKQKGSLGAPWANVAIGYDKTNKKNITINDVGCLITSIAMQIAHSGIPTGNITDFNPGTFAEGLKAANILNSGGGIKSYYNIKNVIPGFKWQTTSTLFGSTETRYNQIRGYAEKGYYIVIEVRRHDNGQHWVALDVKNTAASNWTKLYIWDPATTKTSIEEMSSYRANKIVCFKVDNKEGS